MVFQDFKYIIPFLIALSLAPAPAQAHESRPVYIEITEVDSDQVLLKYKIPLTLPDYNLPTVILEDGPQPYGDPLLYKVGDGFVKQQLYIADRLNAARVSISYPIINPSVSSIISVSLLNGQQFNKVLGPEELEWSIPAEESRSQVAGQYAVLGIQHILEGWDHLLFLVCLILVAGTGRKMLITITGFTISHSITLVLSTLGLVTLPIAPVEAVIALSVVFLASEIAIRNKDSWTYRYPISVSSSFGLLHGFGFASVLSDIGLPQTQVPISLLFFNVGVEIGQLIFLGAVIVVMKVLARAPFAKDMPTERKLTLEKGLVYVVGSIASFWMIERVAGFL